MSTRSSREAAPCAMERLANYTHTESLASVHKRINEPVHSDKEVIGIRKSGLQHKRIRKNKQAVNCHKEDCTSDGKDGIHTSIPRLQEKCVQKHASKQISPQHTLPKVTNSKRHETWSSKSYSKTVVMESDHADSKGCDLGKIERNLLKDKSFPVKHSNMEFEKSTALFGKIQAIIIIQRLMRQYLKRLKVRRLREARAARKIQYFWRDFSACSTFARRWLVRKQLKWRNREKVRMQHSSLLDLNLEPLASPKDQGQLIQISKSNKNAARAVQPNFESLCVKEITNSCTQGNVSRLDPIVVPPQSIHGNTHLETKQGCTIPQIRTRELRLTESDQHCEQILVVEQRIDKTSKYKDEKLYAMSAQKYTHLTKSVGNMQNSSSTRPNAGCLNSNVRREHEKEHFSDSNDAHRDRKRYFNELLMMEGEEANARKYAQLLKKQSLKKKRERENKLKEKLLLQQQKMRLERRCMYAEDRRVRLMLQVQRQQLAAALTSEARRVHLVQAAERKKMLLEDEYMRQVANIAKKQTLYQSNLKLMQDRVAKMKSIEDMRCMEAKSRLDMQKEELSQQRLERLLLQRANMQKQTIKKQSLLSQRQHAIAMQTEKDGRYLRRLAMMKEDIASMRLSTWLTEAARIRRVLWKPDELAVFECSPQHDYELSLLTLPIFLDWVAPAFQDCDASSDTEEQIVGATVGRKKMRHVNVADISSYIDRNKNLAPKPFFYHEFYEEDPTSKPLLTSTDKATGCSKRDPRSVAISKARWKLISEKLLSEKWRSTNAILHQMHQSDYEAAYCTFLQQISRMSSSPVPAHDFSTKLLCQLWKGCIGRWQESQSQVWLRRSNFLLTRIIKFHSWYLFASPNLLHKGILLLESLQRYRRAVEWCGTITQKFPRYPRLHEIIFRAAVCLFALKSYRQSQESLSYVYDLNPLKWPPHCLAFVIARAYSLQGPSSRDMVNIIMQEAFTLYQTERKRTSAVAQTTNTSNHNATIDHRTWKEWGQDEATWRQFGDFFYEKREYVLAKDSYSMMLRKSCEQYKLTTASRIKIKEEITKQHAEDWFRMAKCFAVFHEKPLIENALDKWISCVPYSHSLCEKLSQWTPAQFMDVMSSSR